MDDDRKRGGSGTIFAAYTGCPIWRVKVGGLLENTFIFP